jgi:hypothetical protein
MISASRHHVIWDCRVVGRWLAWSVGASLRAAPTGDSGLAGGVAVNAMLDLTNGNVRMVQGLSRHANPRTLMKYDDARRDDAGTLAQMLGNDQTE